MIARAIYDFLREPVNAANISALTAAGVTMALSSEQQSKGDRLAGQTVVISGTFTHHSREEYKDIIEREGGKNAGSISKKPLLYWPARTWDRPNARNVRN